MSYVTEQILESLREARVRKGFSQRELSARSGVPCARCSSRVKVTLLLIEQRVPFYWASALHLLPP